MAISESIGFSAIAISTLIRWLVGRFPHSGQDVPPMYGDYEAQRHWMEITTNLHPDEWYKNSTYNDLSYWGLDYPPLSAYHMFINGAISNLFNSSWTELSTSKGTDTYEQKIFMRSTVLVSDLLIYTSAIVYFFKFTHSTRYNNEFPTRNARDNTSIYILFALMYPAQILIDHGHFQYNCVFMGLVIWAVIFITKERQLSAAFIFSLALNYKQMALYYALPFFWYLFGKNIRSANFFRGCVNITLLAITVSLTFAICWTPFLTNLELASQVIRRLFPFNRGIYEDKVANLWCCLSIIIKFKQTYNISSLIKFSTFLTLFGTLPSGLNLLWKPSLKSFKYSLVSSSLVFFLTSFQVHEKTILVPAVPILLLFREHPYIVNWFIIVSTFSLQPLLIKDKLTIPYFVLLIIYIIQSIDTFKTPSQSPTKPASRLEILMNVIYLSSICGCFILSVASLIIPAPDRYPDIHQVVNAIYSFGHFIIFLAIFYHHQFKPISRETSDMKTSKLIKKD